MIQTSKAIGDLLNRHYTYRNIVVLIKVIVPQVFIQKVDALQMELDDKIAVLGEIAMMMEEQEVTNDEIIDYINELDQ